MKRKTPKAYGKYLQRQLLHSVWTLSVRGREKHFLTFLQKQNTNLLDTIVSGMNRPSLFGWDSVQYPDEISHFGDLAFIFWLTPLNRGLLRQDMDEAFALFQAVSSLDNPVGVEIGRYFGASTVLLALAVGHGGKVISIDIAPQNDKHVLSVLERYALSRRTDLVVGDANKVTVDQEIDFIFIDGDHSYEGAKRDHNRWGQRVKVGGYIIHHDMACARRYATQWASLARLRNEILDCQRTQVELVREVGSLSIFRRIASGFTELE